MGKAVVFAKRPVTIGDTRGWLDDPTVRDVPCPGERIGRGAPVCTVFARADDAATCYRRLVSRAATIYEVLAQWDRRAA